MSSATLAFLDLGFQELVIVMLFGLLLYGGRLPEVARSLGRTVAEFKKNAQGLTREFHVDLDAPPPPPKPRKDFGAIPRDTREDEPPVEEPADEMVDESELDRAEVVPGEAPAEDSENAVAEPAEELPADEPVTPFSSDPPLPPDATAPDGASGRKSASPPSP